jgi:hypothetical protein
MHRLFVPEPSEKATQFVPVPAKGTVWENTPNGAATLQHSSSIYVAATVPFAKWPTAQ